MNLLGRLLIIIFIVWIVVGLGSYFLNWNTNDSAKILSIGTILAIIGTVTKRAKIETKKEEQYKQTARIRSYSLPWIGILLLVCTTLGFSFYWMQIRPTQIKHDCSWARKYQAKVPAQSPMNAPKLAEKGIIHSCSLDDYMSPPKTDINQWSTRNIWDSCQKNQNELIEKYKNGTPEIPAKEWWEQATEDEYKFCLHDKGL